MNALISYFKSLPLKELLALLFFSFAVVLNAISAIFDFTYERNNFAIVQSIAVLINTLLLLHYLRYRNLRFATFGLSIVYSVEMQMIMYYENFTLYSYFFLLFLPLIAYLTLSLRESTIMTMIHYTSVALFSGYAYFVWGIKSDAFYPDVIYTFVLSSFFVILFGLFYHLRIIDGYYRLFEDDKKYEVALGEIHHRIRNNLSIISSMFSMQARQNDKEDIQALIDKNRKRIETVASIHDTLYTHENGDLINFEQYADELMDRLLSLSELSIKVKIKIDELYFSPQVMQQMGIIIHELLTNSLKYAFDSDSNNIIELTLQHHDNQLHFYYHDNGRGCDLSILDQTPSFGSNLIALTVKELHGTLHYESNRGFTCQITLPDSLLQRSDTKSNSGHL